MSLKDQIMTDVKTAMKAKEMDKLQTLRGVQAAIKNKEIENRPNELTDSDVLDVLKKLAKQRKDSIEQFEQASRQDLVEKEKEELSIIQTYLPKPLSEEKVRELVVASISEVGATSMKEMGAVMKLVLEKTGGAADNKVVSQLVKESLQG